jgi:hypothetical protein
MNPWDGPRPTDNDVYRPILRPRRGELIALHHVDPADAHRLLPIIEMSAPSRDAPHEIADLIHLVREFTPRTAALAVDLGAVPDSGDALCSPPLDLAESLAERHVTMVPVLRSGDSDRRLVEQGLAARMHGGRAVLRLQPHPDAAPGAATTLTERILRGTGLDPQQIDLVIDLAATACRSRADSFEDQAHRVVRWARTRTFSSVTVAAGAMPPNLDDLPTDQPVRVRRLDAALWARLAEPGVGYADYGVTSPVRRGGVHHRQLPTLRYTTERDWWIYRWARRGGRGDDRCHDLCRTLITSPQWPAAGPRFSWGDAEIARRARAAPGAGTASSWIAWSTSHHIAHVLWTLSGAPPADPPATVARLPRSRRPCGW